MGTPTTLTLEKLRLAKQMLESAGVPEPHMVWLPDMPEPVRVDQLNRERDRLNLPALLASLL